MQVQSDVGTAAKKAKNVVSDLSDVPNRVKGIADPQNAQAKAAKNAVRIVPCLSCINVALCAPCTIRPLLVQCMRVRICIEAEECSRVGLKAALLKQLCLAF